MEKKSKGIYTLKHISVLDGVQTPIPFKKIDGTEDTKLSLTEIDSFTTNFANSQEMLFYFQSIGYKFYNSKFIIEYNQNHKEKNIDLVFSKQHFLRELALNNQGKYVIEKNDIFYRYLYKITDVIATNDELIRYLRTNNFMNLWLYENLFRYIACKSTDVESSHIYLTRLKKELAKYKTIRNLEIGIKEYENQLEIKQNKKESSPKTLKKLKPKYFIEGQGQLFNPDNL